MIKLWIHDLKLTNSILKATAKRPVSMEQIELMVDDIERTITANYDREVQSTRIGEMVMERLRSLDGVAYIRFASVYQQFGQISDFLEEIRKVSRGGGRGSGDIPARPGERR